MGGLRLLGYVPVPAEKPQKFMNKRNYFFDRSRISLQGYPMSKTERSRQGSSPIIGFSIRYLRNMGMAANL